MTPLNPDTAEELACYPRRSTEETLYRTPEGEFFIDLGETWLNGRRLEPDEDFDPCTQGRAIYTSTIIPITAREAIEWCIKTRIPETFRGYLLDCLPPE